MPHLGFAQSASPEPLPPDPDLQAAQPVEEEEEESVRDAVSGALSTTLLAWGVSVLMHAGMVLLAILLVWQYVQAVPDEEVIIPIARLSDTPGTPLNMQTTQRQQQQSSSARRSLTVTQTTQTIESKVTSATTLIGLSGGSAAKGSPIGTGIGAGEGLGAGMYGAGGNAKRIIYVVDASGSLLDSLPFVLAELKRSISELSEKQVFNVIFFNANLGGSQQVVEVPPGNMRVADSANKQRAIEWIDATAGNIIPGGKTDPIPAVKRALAQNPQLMFLLSDNITGRGIYELDQDTLLAEIKRANRGNAKINTIQFLYPDRIGTLQKIADSTGGIYKYVDAREVGLR